MERQLTEYDWPCHPDASVTEDFERELVARRDEVFVVAESAKDLDYDYDEFAVVRLGEVYALLNTCGCSCPSPTETWGECFHGTKDEVIQYLREAAQAASERDWGVEEETIMLDLLEQME